MSKGKDYIPSGNKEFFDWQDNLVARVVLNAVAWLVAAGKVTALQAQQTIYVPLYNAIKTKAGRTPQQVDAHTQGRKVYEAYLRTFVKENLINNTAISHDEKVGLGLNPGGSHGPRPKITTAPVINLFSLGDLQVRIEGRVIGDESRPSIQKESDGLEIKAMIGTIPPKGFNDSALNTFISTKARFIHSFDDPSLAGQTLYLYARWINTSDNTKSGPYCALANVVVR